MLKHAEGLAKALVINTLLEMKSDSIVHKIGDKVFIFNNELPESSELYRVLHAEGIPISWAMYWLGSLLYKRKKRTKKNPPRLKLIISLGGGGKNPDLNSFIKS